MDNGANIELFPAREMAEITLHSKVIELSMSEYLMIVDAIMEIERLRK